MMVQDTFESGVLTKRKCPSPSSGTSTPLPLIEKIKQSISLEKKFFSLEFFPPRTPAGAANLIGKLEKYSNFLLFHRFKLYNDFISEGIALQQLFKIYRFPKLRVACLKVI